MTKRTNINAAKAAKRLKAMERAGLMAAEAFVKDTRAALDEGAMINAKASLRTEIKERIHNAERIFFVTTDMPATKRHGKSPSEWLAYREALNDILTGPALGSPGQRDREKDDRL